MVNKNLPKTCYKYFLLIFLVFPHFLNRWRRSLFMHKLINSVLMEDTEVSEQPLRLSTLNEKLTKRSEKFLESVKNSSQPFALYFSFAHVHTPLRPGKAFKGQSLHGPYGDR